MPSKNHDGIRQATEAEAVLLFELPEVKQVADEVAARFRESDLHAGRGEGLRRDAQWKWLDAEATTQADGGRQKKAAGNQDFAQAALATAQSLVENSAGEKLWADLAAKHSAYVPHSRRLEIVATEHPGNVYCYDVDEGEMGMHAPDTCPNGSLRHSPHVTMLRRKGKNGKLEHWPGRKED